MFNNIIRPSLVFKQNKIMTDSVSFQQKISILKDIVEGFPLKCKLFLQLLLSYLPHNGGAQLPKDFKKAYTSFTQTFQKMNNDQKIYFIGQISDCVATRLRNHTNGKLSVLQGIETSCEMKTSFMRISFWEKRTFKYMQQCGQIHLTSPKKEDILELKNYLVRKSVSEKDSVVFEAIEKSVSQKMAKITLKFSNSSILEEIYINIRKNIIELTFQRMEDFIKQDINQCEMKKESKGSNKGFTILTTKTMTEYFNTKQKMIEKLKNSKSKALLIFKKDDMKIYRSSENKKYYYLEQNIHKHETIASIREHTPITGSQSIPNKIIFEVLESFAQNITANYYKLDVGRKQYEFVVIAEKIQREGSYLLTMKTATHFFLDISLEFILISIKKITENHFYFSISMILDPHSRNQSKINAKVIDLMLAMTYNDELHYRKSSIKNIPAIGTQPNCSAIDIQGSYKIGNGFNYNQSVRIDIQNHYEENIVSSEGKKESSSEERSEEKSSEEDECFFTIVQDDEEPELEFFDCLEDKMMSRKGSEKIELETELTVTQDPHYLKTKDFSQPLPNSSLKVLKQHYLFVEWRRSSKGGVICINEEVIRQQNKILKLVITRIGRNIFKGNSVMNISLPIQLFRDESSLISLARNLTYAPLIIEPAVKYSPLQKMKKIILFQISMSPLALSTKKPFNPIIGETFQAEIAGCPLFMQQLSHHPPISSLFFIGRGYKIYGTFKVEATLGLNCARGSSNANMVVQFDDGDKLLFDLPVMVINGLIFGERSIYYEGASYIIDPKNYLITELTYNSNNLKKGLFSFKNESPDFLSGEIYKVSQHFMNKLMTTKKKMSPKKDEEHQILSKIEGEWNGKIVIDGKETYDFEKQFPLQLQTVACPLPSDCTTRTDVIELRKGDMNIAQDEKDRLQDFQRRDKKLRQNFSKQKQ